MLCVPLGKQNGTENKAERTSRTLPAEAALSPALGREFGLRPSTAYTLLQTAGLGPGSIVLDCMAGLGTIPLQAALSELGCFSLGGDLDEETLWKGVRVLEREEPSLQGRCALVPWDSRRIPIRSGLCDAVVVDMPFGVRCGKKSYIVGRLLPNALMEIARVLRPGGKAVLLINHTKGADALLAGQHHAPLYDIETRKDVNIAGMSHVGLYILKRTTHPVGPHFSNKIGDGSWNDKMEHDARANTSGSKQAKYDGPVDSKGRREGESRRAKKRREKAEAAREERGPGAATGAS